MSLVTLPKTKLNSSYSCSYRIVASLSLLFWAWLVAVQPTLAIGPGTGGSKIRVNDERIGPYILLVATSPLPVTVGQMSVWVRVTDNKTNELRRQALVLIEATPRGGEQALTSQATHQNAGNDYDYVAHLDVQNTGQWDVKVSVKDELGQADVAFTETVTQGMSLNVIVGLAIPFVVAAIIVGIYLWRRSATAG
jgi:hypothetical protein